MHEAPKTRPSLLLRMRDRQDARAWGDFVEIYEPLVYRLARGSGFQDADARELTQEVLLAVSKAIERWDFDPARGSFRAWLFRVARNLMVNFLVKQKRQPHGVGDTDMQRLLAEQPAPESEQSAYFDLEYRRRLFRWAADRTRHEFQTSTWQAFWKSCVEGLPIPEVTAQLGLSRGAVYVARSRVMARLRQEIEQVDQRD
jgi:RNA polymerase sigma-70 factor (ECF subfamily)